MRKNITIITAIIVTTIAIGGGVLFSHYSKAQVGVEEIKNVDLLREYFLPIQALTSVEDGKIVIGANECDSIYATDVISGTPKVLDISTTTNTCKDKVIDEGLGYSPKIGLSGVSSSALKTNDGLEITDGNLAVKYDFAVTDKAVYQMSLGALNKDDALYNLSRTQYKAIKDDLSSYDFPDYSLLTPSNTATNRELTARRLLFQVSLDDNIIGVIAIKDLNEIDYGSIDLGVVDAGDHSITLTFANDLNVSSDDIALTELGNSCTPTDDCGEALSCNGATDIVEGKCTYSGNVDVNGDTNLTKTPVIKSIEIKKTKQTNDVIGVRVYTNPRHLNALQWYRENLVKQGNPVPTVIDGYNGVLDDRTAYINAANVAIPSGGTEPVFYTNIYVIAYNVNASPLTIEISNKIINNWKFNKNILDNESQIEGEKTKDRLRRDTTRLEQINIIRDAIENYKRQNGKYPTIQAGTYESGHVLSTWPTWQSILGNELGVLLPTDPLNVMATDFYSGGNANPETPRQYDCTNDYEKTNCVNVCTRDENDEALTGCKVDQQCVSDKYCSVIPAGYDPVTGWSEDNNELWFNSSDNKTDGGTKKGRYKVLVNDITNNTWDEATSTCSDSSGNPLSSLTTKASCLVAQTPEVDGGYNTYGNDVSASSVDKYNDDAFVYQYTALDGGNSYLFNYRLEFQGKCTERRFDGTCKEFTTTKCNTGSCYIDEFDTCVDAGEGVYGALDSANPFVSSKVCLDDDEKQTNVSCTEATKASDCAAYSAPTCVDKINPYNVYKNLYCFAGNVVNSCGNGILQPDAGETCEFSSNFSSGLFCDQNYGSQDWYNENNISEECTTSCRLASEITDAQLPIQYNPQTPGLSCGGYCGDNIIQYEFGEQCDQGAAGGVLKKPIEGGSGGVSADSQYKCYGAVGSTVGATITVTTATACQTFGGYCGDGEVETSYGEECDPKGYIPPTPQKSVDQLVNYSFESGLQGWSGVKTTNVNLQFDDNFTTNAELEVFNDKSQNYSKLDVVQGRKALAFTPKVDGVGIGQRVLFKAGSTITLSAQIKANITTLNAPQTFEARVYQYDFINNEIKDFSTGGSFISQDMEVTDVNRSGDTGLADNDITKAYDTYEATIDLPAADGTNLNTGTYIALVAKGTNFTSPPAYFIDSLALSSDYQLNYACSVEPKTQCQFTGGFCGDGILQDNFGEVCDLDADNGALGSGCSRFCAEPYCGDGVTDTKLVGGSEVQELCDSSNPNDPNAQYCNSSCTKLSAGGSCSFDEDCASDNCVNNVCAPKFGEAGCDPNSPTQSCPVGFTCDDKTLICSPTVDNYLSYHFSPTGIKYGNTPINCPSLRRVVKGEPGKEYLKDACTGLEFLNSLDLENKKTYYQALKNTPRNVIIPTVKQLYTLAVADVSDANKKGNDWPFVEAGTPDSIYADNVQTNFCTLDGGSNVNYGGGDKCLPLGDSRFLYWTRTPFGNEVCYVQDSSLTDEAACNAVIGNGWLIDNNKIGSCYKVDTSLLTKNECIPNTWDSGVCSDNTKTTKESCIPNIWDYEGYYAVDFSKGTVDVVSPLKELRVKYVNNVSCGDGIIQGNEQCEFNTSGNETGYDNSCTNYTSIAPYDAGKVHCDVNTCRLRYDNCVIKVDTAGSEGFCSNDFSTVCGNNTDCNTNDSSATCVKKTLNLGGGGDFDSTNVCNDIGVNQSPVSYGTNLTENFPSKNYTFAVNEKTAEWFNRRPVITTTDANGNITGYDDSVDDDAVYDTDSTVYLVADNGLIASTGADLGYKAKELIVDWNDTLDGAFDITADASFTPVFTNASSDSTLINCEVPIIIDTTFASQYDLNDSAIVQAINDADTLVSAAEADPTAANIDEAQTAVSYLIDNSNPNKVINNTQVVADLQHRLDILVETLVIEANNIANQIDPSTTVGIIYSRWAMDQTIGRTSVNTGEGRTDLTTGAGGNLTTTCYGVGCTQNVSWNTGKFGNALTLNGDDYLYTDATFLDTSQGTVSMWIRTNWTSDLGLWSYYKDAINNFKLYFDSTNKTIKFNVNGTDIVTSSDITTIAGWNVNAWHNITLTYDSSGSALYVDGTDVTEGTGSAMPLISITPSDVMYFATNYDGTYSDSLTGAIDEIRIYDAVLGNSTTPNLDTVMKGSDVQNDGSLSLNNKDSILVRMTKTLYNKVKGIYNNVIKRVF